MGPGWVRALLVSGALTAVIIPVLRRIALATEFFDLPAEHKSHFSPIPYLGGVGIIAGVIAGFVAAGRVNRVAGAMVVAAAILGAMGLVDDDRKMAPGMRLWAELAAAVIAVLVGFRIHATGVPVLDVTLTLFWIVGVTNALNLLDNMDGLAAGCAATIAFAALVLALLSAQYGAASLAAALVGACLGFLKFNRPPASIFMGDAGSLFLGFVLALLTIDLAPTVAPPGSFVVPLLLLAVPVLDTTTVVMARSRRRRSPLIGGRDHLSHRLVARGWSPGRAVITLVGAVGISGVLAVLAGRRVMPLSLAVLGEVVVVIVLCRLTATAVYPDPPVGLRLRTRLVLGVSLGGVALVGAAGARDVADARAPLLAGVHETRAALDSLSAGDRAGAVAAFGRAERSFSLVRRGLSSPFTSAGLAVPGLSSNVRGTRTVSSVGLAVAQWGQRSATTPEHVDGEPIDDLNRYWRALADEARVLGAAAQRLGSVDRSYVVPTVERAGADLRTALVAEVAAAARGAELARLLSALLGANGPGRYFVGVQDTSDPRGSGGRIAYWGELAGVDGTLRLERAGPIEELVARQGTEPGVPGVDLTQSWRQVNTSPDFPTTGRAVAELYVRSGGPPVDGVIAVDPAGLAALLGATDPFTVPGWPEPIHPDNLVGVMRTASSQSAGENRPGALLDQLLRRSLEAVSTAATTEPARLVRSLNRDEGGHTLLWLRDIGDQRTLAQLGMDGGMPPAHGDTIMVVNQDVEADHGDSVLQRNVRYSVRLEPTERSARVSGHLEVILENDAPPGGRLDESRSNLSVYTPLQLDKAVVEGRALTMSSRQELDRSVHSAVVSVPPSQSRTVGLDLLGTIEMEPGGWYRLDLLHQPSVRPDRVQVSVSVPRGWRIADRVGAVAADSRRVTVDLDLEQPETVWVRLERAGVASLWDRIWERG